MNLFDGLGKPSRHQAATTNTISSSTTPSPAPTTVCSAHSIVYNGVVASLSVSKAQDDGIIHLQAGTQSLSHLPGHPQHKQLLCACEQQPALWLPHPSTPCLLLLFKLGPTLELHSLKPGEKQAAALTEGRGLLELVASFQHEGFASLPASAFQLLPGPVLLVQPEPEQLLLLLPPAGQLCPVSSGTALPGLLGTLPTATAAAAAGAGAQGQQCNTTHSAPPAWQLLDLDLPAELLLQSLTPTFPTVYADMLSSSSRASDGSSDGRGWCSMGLSVQAVGHWQLLHSSCSNNSAGNSRVEVLLALPVTLAGHKTAVLQLPQDQQQQQQQQFELVYQLHVDATPPQEAPAAADSGAAHAVGQQEEGAGGVIIAACGALPWQVLSSCAAVCTHQAAAGHATSLNGSSMQQQQQQVVAVGSVAGDVSLMTLTSSSLLPGSSTRQQQQQEVFQTTYTDGGKVIASAQLPGRVQSVVHLPHAHLAGAIRQNVLAVLHQQHGAVVPGTASSAAHDSSGMAVSLLQLVGSSELQVLATVQGAVGLCAPAAAPLGMVCPWQHTQQHSPRSRGQQQQVLAAHADSSAVRLAAIIALDHSSSSTSSAAGSEGGAAAAAAAAGLGCCAWLEVEDQGADGLQGPLLGVLAHAPACLGSAAAAADVAAEGSRAVQQQVDSSELSALQSMLDVLDTRWQQETRSLCALQHRVITAQRLAAAAHRRLCQMAADALYPSTVRQYLLPLSSVEEPGAGLAVYRAGRQLAEEQQPPGRAAAGAGAAGSSVAHPSLTQLLAELVSVSSSLVDQQVRLEVCLKPVLQLRQQAGPLHADAGAADIPVGGPGGPFKEWQGALLQPCHAELLLWHADTSAVTATSSWSWDALTGCLTVTAHISTRLLLQLHDSTGWGGAHTRGPEQRQQGQLLRSTDPVAAAEGPAGVAQAIAAAAGHLTDGLADAHSSPAAPPEALQLCACVAVSACCSSQAVVQGEEGQQQQQQQYQHQVLQRSQLLAPAIALLHLHPFEFPLQQLLLQGVVASCATLRTSTQQQQARVAGASIQAPAGNVHSSSAVAPDSKPAGALGGGNTSRPASMPEVVPPTPYSAAGSEYDLGVIPDSQEDEEEEEMQEEARQPALHDSKQQQQHMHLPQQQHLLAAAAAVQQASPADAMDVDTLADNSKGRTASAEAARLASCSADKGAIPPVCRKQLLLQSQKADLHLLPVLLQQLQPLQLTASSPSSCEDMQQQPPFELVLHNSTSHTQTQHRPAGGDRSSSSSSSTRVECAFISPHLLLVTLAAPTALALSSLEQLVVLTVQRIPGGQAGGVSIEASCLEPTQLAGLVAATTSLTDAIQLHVMMLEGTLQQVAKGTAMPSHQQPSGPAPAQPTAAAGSGQQACTNTQQPACGVGLLVDGVDVGAALSECWMRCLDAQAAVDLVVSQIGKARG